MVKTLVFLSLVLWAVSCESPSRAVSSALLDSWTALRPYTEAGINASDLGDDAKAELLAECAELQATLEGEVLHGR